MMEWEEVKEIAVGCGRDGGKRWRDVERKPVKRGWKVIWWREWFYRAVTCRTSEWLGGWLRGTRGSIGARSG